MGGPKRSEVERSQSEKIKIDLSIKNKMTGEISIITIGITRLHTKNGIWGFDGIIFRNDGSRTIGIGVFSFDTEDKIKSGFISIYQ